MNLEEIIKPLTSGKVPAVALSVGGIVILLVALKLAKGFAKFIFILAALALIAGAAWWHFYKQ